ncbi:uncharacterized protein SOCEGT47_070570 [Sorangium cellulosum]|uniref:Uncharacterized protein n=1 Tax=Sorangium cellulosum TaxID=56 RepID=A0A4P2QB10_SORCE|nr:hypothetical protein [Sorangium cellulosum]AUX26488.1 uncharacterized protein SOCEGT47_070570 [Sorangium cellulosum]
MPTPYRDDLDALNARHDLLAEELAVLKERTAELSALREAERRLEGELDAVRRQLDERAARRSLALLERVRVASPCNADWDGMVGDDRVRFCDHCQKDVYNLSGMPRDEAERMIREAAGAVCVRLYRRADGTVLTADCPVGARRRRVRQVTVAAVGGGLLAAGAALVDLLTVPVATVGAVEASPREVAPPSIAPSPVSPHSITPREVVRNPVVHADPGDTVMMGLLRPLDLPLSDAPGSAVTGSTRRVEKRDRPPPGARATPGRPGDAQGVTAGCKCAPGDPLCTCL